MIKKFKEFENYDLRGEYGDIFEPMKEEDMPQDVPGFESGTIDPEDDEVYHNLHSDFNELSEKELYEKFKIVTKERNFKETKNEIKINISKLYHDFIMSIYNPNKHYSKFLREEIIGKYISDGVIDFMTDIKYYGIIKGLNFQYVNESALVSAELVGIDELKYENSMCNNIITIDKLKSNANKFNL